MSDVEKSEFTEHTSTFMRFFGDLFISASEDISGVFISNSNDVLYSSDWKEMNLIIELTNKWLNNALSSTVTIESLKFIKLHDSPFNLIYRSIQGQKALIGSRYKGIIALILIAQSHEMQLQSTALKDIISAIIQMGQKATGITISVPNTLQMHISLPENDQIIKLFIQSLKHMHFLCDYKDKGDSIIFQFHYKKVVKKEYTDDVYKQYMKK